MKILVFGAGAIGSAFGGFLSKYHDVTLLGRLRHLRAIRSRGLEVSGIWGRHTFRNFRLETDFKNLVPQKPFFDLILVTVKSYDTYAAGRAVRKIAGPGTLVVSLQNGLGNIEALRRFLPSKQVLAGRVIFGVEVPGPGRIKITVIAAPTAVGETHVKRVTPRVRRLAKIFVQAGLPAVAVRDVESLLWAKVIYNCALNPLASLLECHYGLLAETGITRLVMEDVIREIYSVARCARVRLEPQDSGGYIRLFYRKLVPRTYHHHPSMLQDLQNGKPTEIGALNGAIVRLGRELGVGTPVNRALEFLIRRKERR